MRSDQAENWVYAVLHIQMLRWLTPYDDLAHRLAGMGVEIAEGDLRERIETGALSATLFVQCLAALKVESVKIGGRDLPLGAEVHTKFKNEIGYPDWAIKTARDWLRRQHK